MTLKSTKRHLVKLRKGLSISFVLVVSFFGLFIGSVLGSLFDQIFGLEFLNKGLFNIELTDFYLFKKLEIKITFATLLGLLILIWFLFKKGI